MAKNTDYVIYIRTSHGQTWSHVKEGDGWTRTGPNGRVHRMSAEQLLSHLLPPRAAVYRGRRRRGMEIGSGYRLQATGYRRGARHGSASLDVGGDPGSHDLQRLP